MNWLMVIGFLREEAERIRLNASSAFPNDFETQKEMRSRAAIADMLARALYEGTIKGPWK